MKICHLISTILVLCVLAACKPSQQVDRTPEPTAPAELPSATVLADESVNNCSLSLGFDVWEPYQYVEVSGNVVGLDIEVISAVVEEMGCEVNYIQDTWMNSLEQLRKGQVDMLLGASKTEAREQFALFSDAYRMEEFSLYVRNGDTKHSAYQSIEDFIDNQSRIGIVEGYYYGPSVSIMLDGSATSAFFMSGIIGELNVARLLDQDIDGYLEDSFIGASILRRKGLSEYIVAHGLTIQTGDIYVMFSRESVSQEQVADFNSALAKVQASDKYADIMKRYGR
jgi:polar amino acid transport system substrate-binding protein